MEKKNNMIYRFLGNTGMQVSVISFGNMIFDKLTPECEEACFKCITKAYEAGVNYFDTAEIYGNGRAETILGKCLKRAGWPRKDYVISTKIYNCGSGVNDRMLSRKHIIEGVNASLARLQLDYVDIIFAHRYDPCTPMEEICRAFNYIIEKGKAFYWSTSQWSAEQIMEAINCCDKLGLIKPVADQVEYSLLIRQRVENELAPLFEKMKYGTTIWSPLAGGYLTGKYNDGREKIKARYNDGSLAPHIVEHLNREYIGDDEAKFYKKLGGLGALAKEFKCSQAQLVLAWCLVNKDVSTAIIGATKLEQLEDSLGAIDVAKRWTPEMEKKVEEVMQNMPEPPLNWRTWQNFPSRRSVALEYGKA